MRDPGSATSLRKLLLDRSPDLRKARVWYEDLPQAQYPVDELVFRTARGQVPTVPRTVRHVVVELARPTNGASTYALLGGTFAPKDAQELRIEAAVAGSPGPPAPWAISTSTRSTQVWLPKAYAEAALDAAAGEASGVALGGGVLRFDRAVEDQVGSSEWMFKVVARAVMRLLAISDSARDDELAEVFRGVLASGQR